MWNVLGRQNVLNIERRSRLNVVADEKGEGDEEARCVYDERRDL
jgi:hypothetical protein